MLILTCVKGALIIVKGGRKYLLKEAFIVPDIVTENTELKIDNNKAKYVYCAASLYLFY